MFFLVSMRILLIEDTSELRELLVLQFTQKHAAVDTVDNGIDAAKLLLKEQYDIIIADYALPGKNGFELCQELRAQQIETPVIIITAATLLNHKILGYAVGADDYIVKPFYFLELYARVCAILRRSKTIPDDTVLHFDTLTLDTVTETAYRNNVAIPLTRTEYQILHLLLLKKGTVVSRVALIEKIWNSEYNMNTNSIETHMRNLRRKIETPNSKKVIYSVAGRGYKIDHQK